MKILILTGNFGMGHYSAAAAIKQEIERDNRDICVDIVDIVEFLMPSFSKVIYTGFNTLVSKWSDLYNTLNKLSDRHSEVLFKNTFVRRLDRLLLEYSPDLVISTLPIGSQYISAYKDIRRTDLPLYTCITDISTRDEWLADNTDIYFVGTEDVKYSLISKGISADKIRVSGIPVKCDFKSKHAPVPLKKSKEILIMGGGLGLLPYTDEFFERLDRLPSVKVTVITGGNKKLYEQLKSNYPSLNVLGYTDKVHEYMQSADLIVTKAGGITLFEAIHSEVPLYVINPFLIHEINNAKYIEDKNIGRVVWKGKEEIADDIVALLHNKQELYKMRMNMRAVKEQIKKETILSDIETMQRGA